MKDCGIIRMDEVGRIVIPKEIRRVLKLDKNTLLEIFVEKDKVIAKKYSPLVSVLNYATSICNVMANVNNCVCAICDTQTVIAVSSVSINDVKGKKLSNEFYNYIIEGSPILLNASQGGKTLPCVYGFDFEYFSLALLPFEYEKQPIGAIMLFGLENNRVFTDEQIKLLKIARQLISSI